MRTAIYVFSLISLSFEACMDWAEELSVLWLGTPQMRRDVIATNTESHDVGAVRRVETTQGRFVALGGGSSAGGPTPSTMTCKVAQASEAQLRTAWPTSGGSSPGGTVNGAVDPPEVAGYREAVVLPI